jgi:hypothetical protein
VNNVADAVNLVPEQPDNNMPVEAKLTENLNTKSDLYVGVSGISNIYVESGSATIKYTFDDLEPSNDTGCVTECTDGNYVYTSDKINTSVPGTFDYPQGTGVYTITYASGSILEPIDNQYAIGEPIYIFPSYEDATPGVDGGEQFGIATVQNLQMIDRVTLDTTATTKSNNLDYYMSQSFDAAGYVFEPIGDQTVKYTGTFDGRSSSGIEIMNLTITSSNPSVGLFEINAGTIQNLKINS